MPKAVKLVDLNLELYECDGDKLEDVGFIKQFLLDFPAQIGMKRVGEPNVVAENSSFRKAIGGYVILKESHIAIHAWPANRYAYVSILSCKEFDKNEAAKAIVKTFKSQNYVIRNLSKINLLDDPK